jgi:hypothetical protein
MKVKDLVQLLLSVNQEVDIRSYEKWDENEEPSVMDVIDVMKETHMRTNITHVYLVLGCEEKQPATVATPPRPYRASD